MSEEQPLPVQRAEARGHAVVWDPPFASSAERWTCSACGLAVLRYGNNIYGSATETDCQPQAAEEE